MNNDYEEMLCQVTDVLKAHNRYHMQTPDHEQAVKLIRDIVTPKGKWVEHVEEKGVGVWYTCSNCYQDAPYEQDVYNNWRQKLSDFCPNCGRRMK